MSSTDPVQMLIDAGAIPASPFGDSSRYKGVALGTFARADGTFTAYARRRFVPALRDIPGAAGHLVRGGERPDLLAWQQYGDPLLYWRIADGNAVIDPNELTDTVGAVIRMPVPPALG
jgi:hypothetical protein